MIAFTNAIEPLRMANYLSQESIYRWTVYSVDGTPVRTNVDRIVYAAADPKAGAVGSLWDLPRDHRLNHRPEVVPGILAPEATALLENFFASRRPIG